MLVKISGLSQGHRDKFQNLFEEYSPENGWVTADLNWRSLKVAYLASSYNNALFLGVGALPLGQGLSDGLQALTAKYHGVGVGEREYRHVLTTWSMSGYSCVFD